MLSVESFEGSNLEVSIDLFLFAEALMIYRPNSLEVSLLVLIEQ